MVAPFIGMMDLDGSPVAQFRIQHGSVRRQIHTDSGTKGRRVVSNSRTATAAFTAYSDRVPCSSWV